LSLVSVQSAYCRAVSRRHASPPGRYGAVRHASVARRGRRLRRPEARAR
jgi:hypothetical protein